MKYLEKSIHCSKFALVILSILMAISLCACGSDESANPACGVYNCTDVSVSGYEMDITEVMEEGASIELKENGTATLTMSGESYSGSWSLDGENFTLTVESTDSTGTLKDGIIEIDYLDMGMIYHYEKEGLEDESASDSDIGDEESDGADSEEKTEE